MRYHLFQKFCGKMVKIKETSFLSTRGAVCFALNCIALVKNPPLYSDLAKILAILLTLGLIILTKFDEDWTKIVDFYR